MTANRLKHIQPRIAPTVTARVVTLDIERIPGRARVKHRGLTIEGEFWDLSGWKHTIGRRIHADDVLEWPRTICAAWRWYGEEEVHFASEWDIGGHQEFMRKLWDVYSDADVTVGHNMQSFDGPMIASGWAEYGWAPPSPVKVIDTLRVARQRFAFESNTLDALAKRLGVAAKTDRYDARVAQAAVNGDKEAQEKIRGYNEGDIIATEAVFDRLRPWLPGSVHLGQWSDAESVCPNCGSENVTEQTGKTIKANVTAYPAYRCDNCGTHMRGTAKVATAIKTRAAR